MGAMIALSGAMLYPIPCIRNALSEVRMMVEEFWGEDGENWNEIGRVGS